MSVAVGSGIQSWIRLVLYRPAYWIRTRRPWPARLIAFIFGAVYVGGQAPFYFWPASLIAIIALVWLLDGAAKTDRPVRSGMWVSWLFGVGQFLAGMYWIAYAFIERGSAYIPLIPFALLLLAGGLALFWMLAGAVAMRFWSQQPWRVLLFTSCFFAAEWLRGHLFTGLPWNTPGLIWPAGYEISQLASVLGVWGLGLLTLFAFSAPAALTWSRGSLLWRTLPSVLAILLFLGAFIFGYVRLSNASNAMVPGVKLRVIQAQIDQSEKWDAANEQKVIDKYLDLSSSPGLSSITHLVWPEGALPLLLLERPDVMEQLAERFADGPVLLAGVTRREATEDQQILYRNSLIAFSFVRGTPALEMVYDKSHLTPFGEYLPFGRQLAATGIKALTPLGGGFTPGPEAITTQIPNAPLVSPQICYESIFSGFTPGGKNRPQWIVNVTNDSWFGPTTGPLQHVQQAQFRAIEEGVPLVRSASSGVSGVIDPMGRFVSQATHGTSAAIDSGLPQALRVTFYRKYRYLPLVLWLVLVLAVCRMQFAAKL